MAKEERTTHFGFRTVPEADKVNHVRRVFDTVVNQYDLMNDLMSLGLHRLMKSYTVELSAVREGQRVLDLAGGTADLACKLAPLVGASGEVVLCDINEAMLRLGRDRVLDRGHLDNVRYVQADAEHLPFPDASFHCVTIGFGLRNFTHIEAALRSILRVLRPGGILLVLEFSTPRHPAIRKAYDVYSTLWPRVGSWVTGDAESYRYLVESIRVHPDQETLLGMLQDAGYVEPHCDDLMNGIVAIHTGRKP